MVMSNGQFRNDKVDDSGGGGSARGQRTRDSRGWLLAVKGPGGAARQFLNNP